MRKTTRHRNKNGDHDATMIPALCHSPTMEEATQRYLAERQRSSSTIKIIAQLAPFWGQFRLADVTEKTMTAYVRTVQHLAQSTQARLARQARTIYLHGCREFDVVPKPMRVPREGQHRIEFLSREEVRELLGGLNPEAKAIATFMVYSGARYCEARLVDVTDLKDMGGSMMCRLRHRKGKDGLWRERWVPLHPSVVEVMQTHGAASGALWRNADGERWHQDASGLRKHMQRVAAKLGLTARPHILRHTFGTLLAREGGDLRTLAELMGHANSQQTRTYINEGNQESAALVGKL